MKAEANEEREATLRNARREALELTEEFQAKAEASQRDHERAEAEIDPNGKKLSRSPAGRRSNDRAGKAERRSGGRPRVGKFRGAIRA